MDQTTRILLDLVTDQMREERERCHANVPRNVGPSLEQKRSIATVVTKLEEAQMWADKYRDALHYGMTPGLDPSCDAKKRVN